MSKKYRPSPFGPAAYAWVNRPDTAFGKSEFKVDLDLSGDVARKFKDYIDGAVERASEELAAAGDGKKGKPWGKHYPYEELLDSDGNKTGVIRFKFRQNSEIKLKDGGTKQIQIGIYDSKDQPMHAAIYGGTELRVMYAFRNTEATSNRTRGVRLDFSMVQVRKLVTSGGGGGFGETFDDGYVEEHNDAAPAEGEY